MTAGGFVSSAPGKVILFGEHAVVYGKTAVAGSIALRTSAEVVPRSDGVLAARLESFGESATWSVEEVRAAAASESTGTLYERMLALCQDKASPAFSVLLFLFASICREAGRFVGLDVKVSSQLPMGAGLGSSAAYSVALAGGFLAAVGLVSQDAAASGALSEEEKARVNAWAFEAEKILHGTPSGIDNSVATFGGVITFRAGAVERCRAPALRFVLTNTRVARNTKALVAGVRALRGRMPDVLDPTLAAIDALAHRAVAALARAAEGAAGGEELFAELEALIDVNHALACALGVGHPALTAVVDASAKLALHSKLTGAGGGGCALTLVSPREGAEGAVAELKAALAGLGFECFEAEVGGPGLLLRALP